MKLKRISFCGAICLCTLTCLCGCRSNEPSDAEKKKELMGQPGKAFDPASVPPEYKAGFEKWQKSNGAKVSGPVDNSGKQ